MDFSTIKDIVKAIIDIITGFKDFIEAAIAGSKGEKAPGEGGYNPSSYFNGLGDVFKRFNPSAENSLSSTKQDKGVLPE